MKTKALFIILALLWVSNVFAGTGRDVKYSPLFKVSLQQSIDKLAGKVTSDGNDFIPTVRGQMCTNNIPMYTQYSSTCVEGGCKQPTSYITCSNTCISGPCQEYNFFGAVSWYSGNQGSSNWNVLPGGVWLQIDHVLVEFSSNEGFMSLGGWDHYSGQYNSNIIHPVTTNTALMFAECYLYHFNGSYWSHDSHTIYPSYSQSNNVNFNIDLFP